MSDERLGEELKRYGLEGMAGNPVDVLLRHIYANHEAALGAKDGTIATLESQNQALQERAEKALAVVQTMVSWPPIGHMTDPKAAALDQRNAIVKLGMELRQLLSPTQETDPE